MDPIINEFNGQEIAPKQSQKNSLNAALQGDGSTPIPVDVKFDQELHSVFQEKPPEAMPEKSHEGAGFFRTLGGKFAEQEEIIQVGEAASRKVQDDCPLDDFVPPNWSATDDKSVYIGVDERNMQYILDATGPKDQRRRYNYVLDQQEYNERINNGSMIAQLLGGGAGFALSPSSLFPVATGLKYAKVSQALLQNLPKMVAGVGISSASHEAVLETTKTGGNLYDWAISTAVDTLMGTAFMGAHLGIQYASEATKLYSARNILKLANQGLEIRPQLDAKGIVKGYNIHNLGDASAAKVSMAQTYLDAALSKNVIHAIPYVGETVGKVLGKAGSFTGGVISPKIRMLTSPFDTIRGYANNLVEHSFDVMGFEKGNPNETPFETMMSMIRGSNTSLKTQYDGLFMKRNGVEFNPKKAGSQNFAGMKDIATKYFKDGGVTRDEFGREVQYALITEEPSDISAVNEAAVMFRESMDPLYLEHLKLNGISDKILKPRTAKGFLSRVYYTARMELNEDEWVNGVAGELGEQDKIINQHMQPIRNLQEFIKKSEEQHSELIRQAEQKKPEEKDIKHENSLNDKIRPINEKLSVAKSALKKAVKPETKAKHQSKIDAINNELKPLQDELDTLRSRIYAGDISVKQSSDAIEVMKERLSQMNNDVQNMLRDNPDLDLLVEDRHAVSANEANAIHAILKPVKDIEKQVAEQQAIVTALKNEKSRKKQAANKGKTVETAQKHAELEDKAQQQIEQEEAKLNELQGKHLEAQQAIYEKMYNKQIPQELYYRNTKTGKDELKDPNNRLKMREEYGNELGSLADRLTAAKAYYDSILNQTAEDNIASIMDKAMGSNKENPLTQRTLMLSDKWLYDNNWLHPDPSINVMNYRNFIGRKNSIKKVLNRLTVNGTFDELITRFANEHKLEKNKLKSITEGITDPKELTKAKKKYDKEVLKLGRRYKRAKNDLELSIANMTGKNKYSAKAREYSRMANLYAVITKLGFLPWTMSTDTMAIVFKHGFWPTVKDGLYPMLKNLGGMLNTEEGEAIRENAAHAYVSQRHVNMAYSDKNWTGTSQTYEPVQGKLTKGLETLAHYSGNFTGANYVENFNERWAAFVINSKIMKAMKDFMEGKISPRDHKDLLKYGIDPKEYAQRFLNGRKEKPFKGAGIGYYWEWADKEASNIMSQAIHRAVKDTVIRRGLLDAPFAMDNPIFSSIFLFKGYALASMTRFLAPLMQQAEGRQLIGTMLMMAAGATQNPLRRLASGQDPMQEEDHMFQNAVRDGGVFSILGDAYQEANFLSSGFLQEAVTNERYRGRTEMGVMNGPVGGMANDMTRIIGAIASREMNKTDLKRIAVNTPIVYSWQTRNLVNKWIENTSLPKTRQAAHKAKQQ
jgi:hypothetical protein